MSHLIISEIDTVYTPAGNQWEKTWHGLETPVQGGIALDGSNIMEVFSPVVQCGVRPDFESPLASDIPEDLKESLGEDSSFANWKMILADCRNGKSKQVWPLYVPRKGYAIHQNRQLFDCMVKSAETVLGQGGFEIVTAGTLGGYSQFFLSIAIKGHDSFQVGKLTGGESDWWNQFFNLNSSHNGQIASTRNLSLVRQVCWNTVNAAIANAEAQDTVSNIRHSKNSTELLTAEVFAADLKKWVTESETYKNTLEAIKAEPMDLSGFQSFAAGVFTQENSDKLSTTSFNRVKDLETLFSRGMGNDGKTVYDAVNAFTEYFTHGRGLGNEKTVKANKRIASANFGRGNQWKLEALRIASDETELKQTIKRGERYFNDYLTVQAAGN